ncbi:MAG: 4-alpha-glucanotransferase [Clostridia bacterium]|nr:4-alpha-glucanotransferase [Clostridia bacterium]
MKLERASGVLMHISSLYGEYSSGAFGKEAKEFIDFLSDCGFKYWQVLPFTMVDECNSPYKSYSAFAGNPYFVDLNTLYKKGLLSKEELDAHRQNTPYGCEYVRLFHTRFKLLKTAALRIKDKSAIKDFIESHPHIADFCKFMALKEANDNTEWYAWEKDSCDENILFAWQFIQYEFFNQWSEIKAYANSKGIKIIGDIPIFVAYDSCDVWANRKLFQLDEKNVPKCVAGVPPDYFSEDGQLWGNPLYDWDVMAKDGYKWWLDRMSLMLELFDGVRIDHFRGLEAYYSIPYGAKTAKDGKWVKGPGKPFIDAIKKLAGDKLIIAEDLGDITNEVIELVNYSGFPGMKVFQFAFLSDGDSPHKPHNYVNNSVAYTGTHDNNTLLGYIWELDDNTRKEVLDYCGFTEADWDKSYDSIIRTVFASNAGLVILPIQDLLGFGSDTRLNIPGKADGNWQYRITKEQLDSIDKQKYRKLNKLFNR